MIRKARQALLLRVGMDRGTGGALSPLFHDGTFEYLPIPERGCTRDRRSYGTMLGQHGAPLAAYLPARLAAAHPHFDPDFTSATYGDAAPRKRRQLAKLTPRDILVFYCGLAPYPPNDAPRLFVIGYLYVKQVHVLTAGDIGELRRLRHRFRNTAHFLRKPLDRELVLVEGDRSRSRFFSKALPLGDGRDNLLRDLERLGYQGSIQRAVGHWVRGAPAMEFLEAWLKHGLRTLIEPRNRLFLLPLPSVRFAVAQRSDAAITVERCSPEPGDWILASSDAEMTRIALFARVNRRVDAKGGPCLYSSLFWHFSRDGPQTVEALRSFGALRARMPGRRHQATIRRLVAWLFCRYRIGSL